MKEFILLVITGLMIGVSIGFFISALLYLSGVIQ